MISNIDKMIIRLIGLSTDEKPPATNGSSFIEMDTGDLYFYDGENSEWIKSGGGGGGGSAVVGAAVVGTAIAG